MKSLPLPLTLLALSPLASASFNLNTSGPDWDYVSKDLANTTSETCKAAYSADINCDVTLLGIVASMRPAFKPTTADIERTCTTDCTTALETYVKGVKDACTATGDKAQESGAKIGQYILQPVELVGQIFQYVLERSCRKQSNGTLCYGSTLASSLKFECDDECTSSFYQISHDYEASAYMFNYYWLVSRGDWWADAFVAGWNRIQKCNGVSVTSSSSRKVTSTGSHSTTSSNQGAIVTGTTTSVLAASVTTTLASSGTSTSTPTSTSVIASSDGSLQHGKFPIIGMVPVLIMVSLFM